MKYVHVMVFMLFMGCASTRLNSSYYYKTQYGDAIEMILKKYQVTEAQLIDWNPKYAEKIKRSFFKGGEKLIIKNPNKKQKSQ